MSKTLRHQVWAVALAGLWINTSEFLRNEWLLGPIWRAHYRELGLGFVTQPVNGVLWLLWGFGFATAIAWLTRHHPWRTSLAVAWGLVFLLMWPVLWNLQVLPLGLLPYAVPWSLLETGGAVWICMRLQRAARGAW